MPAMTLGFSAEVAATQAQKCGGIPAIYFVAENLKDVKAVLLELWSRGKE